MTVSIIIPTANRCNAFQDCVSSIREHTPESYEIVVVDSSADDRTEQASLEAGLTYMKLPSIVGFSKAVNAGSQICSGDHVVWLNDDCLVNPSWLTNMLRAMEEDPTIGIGAFFFSDARWPKTGSHVFFYRNEVYPNFGCVRRQVWEQLCGFNEGYFAYGAEVDLAYRCRESGSRVVPVVGACVHHLYLQDQFLYAC